MKRLTQIRAVLGAVVLSGAAWGFAPAAFAEEDEGEARYQQLIDKVAPSVVTVRAVVAIEFSSGGQGQKRESRNEVQAVVVRDSGLLMMTNAPFRTLESGDMSVKRSPTELKVVFESEEKEYDAELVATDSKLGLAFLRVKELEDRKLTAVSFDDPAEVELGDRVASVSRLEKGYDYAPYVNTARVSGSIKKPRKAQMLDGTVRDLGLPVYTIDGRVAGVMTSIESGMADSDGPMSFFGGGGRAFLLPAKVVGKVIEQAEKQAQQLAEDAAAAPADMGEGDADSGETDDGE